MQAGGDSEVIRGIVESVGALWDKHEFPKAREHFAEVVEIDYRSLGAPSVTQDPVDQLERNWRAVLPGFDKTYHLIDNFEIEYSDEGNTATSKSKVLAYHIIKGAEGGESWTLMGGYTHVLARGSDGTWKITKMQLNVEQQFGNLGLLVKAATKVAMAAAAAQQ